MEKIIHKALELAGFKNADVIVEILNCTPSPHVGAEMLLGVYKPTPMNLKERFRKHRYSSKMQLAEIVSINDLADTITYLKHEQKTKWVYWLTKEDKQNNVFVTEKPSGTNHYDSGYVPTTGYTSTECTDRSGEFNDKYVQFIELDHAFQILHDWNAYDVTPEELPF